MEGVTNEELREKLKKYIVIGEEEIMSKIDENEKIIKIVYVELDKKKINEEKKKIYMNEYREEHKEEIKKKILETNKKRYQTDEKYREYVKEKRREHYHKNKNK